MAAFGIHFGSTNACLAVCKDGKSEVIANEAGDRVTPAIVAFTDHDITVGLPAKQGLIRNASNTVVNIKQLIGCHGDEPETQEIINSSSVKIINKDSTPCYEVDYKEKKKVVSPQEIASHIYKNMLQIADHQVGSSESHDAVLTVPVCFSEQRRQVLCEAAEKAGFKVLRVINEPSAALLSYDIGQVGHSEQCKAFVYRLGGSTLDVTILDVSSGMYQVLSTLSTPDVSGKIFTNVLVQHFAAEFKRQWKCDCLENNRSKAKLWNAAEHAKHILSNLPSAQCSVDSLYEGIDFQCNISRARFEGLCSTLLQNCISPIQDVLKQAGLQASDIDKVVLCGGSTKIPSLQAKITGHFPKSDILTSLSPDEVVAIGAAKEASILIGNSAEESAMYEKQTQLPCLSTEILLELDQHGIVYEKVFARHTPIPSRVQKFFVLAEDQTAFCLHVLITAADGTRTTLAKLIMQDIDKGSARIHAVFHVRGDGSLHITCTESESKKTAEALVEAS